ncbi:MAG: hypothetical protein LBT27_05555 [Prevotellaceae bacterium]|jgi:hypothetical protein|nr:hypothetical protein [Prevotellaceae bacterium]
MIAEALKNIYEKNFDPETEIEYNIFNATLDTFNLATAEGLQQATRIPEHDFIDALKYNNAVFSAFRTHRMQNDMAKQLTDENGNLKSFSQFAKDTENIRSHYVKSWLKTEYNTAVIRAHQAADWKQYEAEKDILPNLEWMPSTSVVPGEDHVGFWGTILPVNDPFWNSHKPGDRWNCKCYLQANEKNTKPPARDVVKNPKNKPLPGLENNPGKDAKLFSDKNAYEAKAYKGAKQAVAELVKNQKIAEPETYTAKKFKSGGVLEKPDNGKQNKNEAKKNEKIYKELAKLYGERYRLLAVTNMPGKKNPDAMNMKTKQLSDAKAPITVNGKNAIQAAIKEASKQKVQEVVIFLEKEYPRASIYSGLKAALISGRNKNIKNIIIRFNDGQLKRYDVNKVRSILKTSAGKTK